jgi:hypothetical protein
MRDPARRRRTIPVLGRALGVRPERLRGRARRRTDPDERVALAGLVALALVGLIGTLGFGPGFVPPSVQVLPLLGGGLLLGRWGMRRLVLAVAASLILTVVELRMDARPGNLLVVAVTALVAYEIARSREDTGLAGREGEAVLVELRSRLEQQGRLPALARPYAVEAALRPAGGRPFAGDFVASALTGGGRTLELALVDVSGKGVAAGTRALLLSGAMGGLLGSVSPREFLPAANAYLDRQEWHEGFATAVHLVLDLVDGSFAVESAGHPPVAAFDAGSGRWNLLRAEGVALGLLPDVEYVAELGRLEPGDALLLYTDGLVEMSGRDLEVGIDKLLGEAERLLARGFAGGADLLVERVAGDSTDDRGLVVLWREG